MKGFLALATNRLAALESGDRSAARSRCSSPTTRRPGPSARGASPRPGPRPSVCRASVDHRRADRAAGGPRAQGDAAPAARSSRAAPPTRAIPTSAATPSSRRPGPSWRSPSSGGRWRPSVRRTREQFPEVPFAALNVGTVAGGSAANVIPDRCEMDLGIRLLPGMAADAMAERVRETVRGRAAVRSRSRSSMVSESPAMIARPTRRSIASCARRCGQHETAQRHVRHRCRLAPATPASSACSSGRAASRWRTGPTSSCRSTSSDARARCSTADRTGAAWPA